MPSNDETPRRRSVGAHDASRKASASSRSGEAKPRTTTGRHSAPSRRDEAPQYRQRPKAAKPDVLKAAKSAAKKTSDVAKKAVKPADKTAEKKAAAKKPAVDKKVPAAKGGVVKNASKVPAGSGAHAERATVKLPSDAERAARRAAHNTDAARATAKRSSAASNRAASRRAAKNEPMHGTKLHPVDFKDNGRLKTGAFTPAEHVPSSRTTSNGAAFVDYFKSHLKVCLPITIALALVIIGGVVDLGASFGKIHPGVKVYGVEVGGMSQDEAAASLEDALSDTLNDARVTVYASQDGAVGDSAALVTLPSGGEDGVAYAEKLSATDMDGDGTADKWTLKPESVGAHVDGAAMAANAYLVGREGNFIAGRIGAWLGKFNLDPVLGFNKDRMNEICDVIDKACGTKIKDSKITISDGQASVVEGNDGWLVNQDELGQLICRAVYDGNATALVAPMQTQAMRITPDTAQRVADQVTAALTQDVTITYKDDSWTMDEHKLADMLSQTVLAPDQYLKMGNGTQKKTKIPTKDADPDFSLPYDTSAGLDASSGYTLQCYVDQEKFSNYLKELLGSKADGGAKNARFDTSSGDTVKIVKSKDGQRPDRLAAGMELQDMLFGTNTDRTIALVDTVIKPERTTEDAEAMGIKERLASWSIGLGGSSNRIKNIRLLCKLIDGSVVAPGDTWSFNDTTGERTAEKGFETAPVIINGKHEDQLGGGICQVATCVFNAACYSGLGIVTRTNHDFYIPTYDDEGFADATVSWDVPDLEWLNDTDNYILLTADASGDNVVVSLWGTDDGRTVECDRGDWKKGTKYKTIKENDDTLPKGTTKVEQAGVDGRSIQIRYLVTSKSGEVLHDIKFNSVYVPQNEIIKVGTKTSDSDKSKKSSD